MKKVILIVVLGLLLSGNAYAGCKKDVKFSWYIETGSNKVFFTFKNNGAKHVRITLIYVSDADGDEILEFEPTGWNYSNSGSNGVFVAPHKEIKISRSNWNAHKYGKTASWRCSYQKPYETSISDKVDNATGAVSDFIGGLFSKDED